MVDEALILRKLADLSTHIEQIFEFRSLSVDEYKSDWKTQRIVDRTLHIMIEMCIDIAGHLISDRKLRVPESYADAFRILNENSIVSDALIEPLVKMAKFRNIIVHQYEKVDPQIVISILQRNIEDLQKFSDEIVTFMKSLNTYATLD